MPHKDPEVRRAYLKKWHEKNREKTTEYRRTWQRENRDHRLAYSKQYYAGLVAKDPAGMRTRRHREWLASRYSLTTEQYDALVRAQNNCCAICGEPPAKRRLHIDHDHKTSAVRGLLCSRCNQAVGFFRDSPDLMERAASYLRTADAMRPGAALVGAGA